MGNRIIGGANAAPGEFPWQLSQQRFASQAWSHSCGAVLLDGMRALSAAHCVDGVDLVAVPLRVLAGLHDRSQPGNAQIANINRYVMHAEYNLPENPVNFPHDIAILHFATTIFTSPTVQFATLPPDNTNTYAGQTITITGWGRISSSNTLPNILQKAQILAQTTAECLATFLVGSNQVWDSQICFLDPAQATGACNGDSGGPAHAFEDTRATVVGITSWGTAGALGNCLQNRPSVYTRVSAYLAWIAGN